MVEEEDTQEHPLFLSSCPRDGDFETNAALGALAALIDESEDVESCTATTREVKHGNLEDNRKENTKAFTHKQPNSAKGDHWKKVNQRRDQHSFNRGDRRPQPYGVTQHNQVTKPKRTRPTLGQAQICLALTSIN